MPSIENQIKTDYLVAYKNKDERAVAALRLVQSAIKNETIKKNRDLNDEEVVLILRREVKQRSDALVEYEQANRSDLVQAEKEELSVLKKYLPTEMTEDEIIALIKKTIKETGFFQKEQAGKLIGTVMSKTKGRAKGEIVAKLAAEIQNGRK